MAGADASTNRSEAEVDLEKKIEELESRLNKAEAAEKARRDRAFVKGWLAGVGDVDFIPSKHRFVVGLQMFPVEKQISETLTERTYYLGAVPRVSLHFGKLYMGFEMPLAFEIFNTEIDSMDPDHVGGNGFSGAGTFAGLEWDEISEYAQVINYIRYGTKEEDLYLNVSRQAAATVGHGTVMRRYNPNIDLDHFHVSAQVDKGFKYGGAEFYTNDIVKYGVTGVLAYVKPGGIFLPDNLFARSASLGVSYTFDRNAPYTLSKDVNNQYLIADELNAPVVEESQVASVLDIDAEVKVFKKNGLDVKTYLDYSRLINTGGDGFSVGGLVRLNLGGNKDDARVHAFRVRGELGAYHARFTPGYFDMFYEIQKYQVLFGEAGDVTPKLQYLEQQTGGYRGGARVEATYALVNSVAVSAAYQTSTDGRDSQLLFHVEVPTGDHLRLLATYARMNLQDRTGMFTLDDPNALLIAKAKLKVLPFLFLNGEVSQMYRLKGVSTDGSDVVSSPEPGAAAEFKNVLRWVLETEVGFEF